MFPPDFSSYALIPPFITVLFLIFPADGSRITQARLLYAQQTLFYNLPPIDDAVVCCLTQQVPL